MTKLLKWPRPIKGLDMNIKYTNKLTPWHPPVVTPILCFKQVLCKSLSERSSQEDQ